jgi:preprotein translocase subunit SecG
LLTAVSIIQIIVSVTLIGILLLQMKGEGLGGVFGGDSAVQHRRRGFEATLFNVTVVLAVIFLALSFLSALLPKLGFS